MDELLQSELRPATLAALKKFYAERTAAIEQAAEEEMPQEDWQLSQFWYSNETATTLAREALDVSDSGSIAFVSCPSVFQACIRLMEQSGERYASADPVLLEYDQRFSRFDKRFAYYDFNQPEKLPTDCLHRFSFIIIDPPFLAEDCLQKIMRSVELLSNQQASNGGVRLLLCTGAVMETVAVEQFGLKRIGFTPTHKNKLGNEFACFANYETSI